MKKKNEDTVPFETKENPLKKSIPVETSKYMSTLLISLAKGEITPDEFREMLTDLNGNNMMFRSEE